MKNKNKKSNDSLFNAKSKKDVIRLLKMGVDINILNEHGQNALFHCHFPEAMQAMIDAGINIHHLDNRSENALFHINDIKTIDILIRNGININHRNQSGQLAFPNFSVTPEAMTLLIESGLDIHTLDNNGRTLLFNPLLADIYILLIEAGCDINHRDHNGQTAFDFLQSSQYDLALAYSIHLKDSSPVIFKHLTYISIELMLEMNHQGIDFIIDNQCRLSLDESEAKEIISIARNITDLSQVTFCLGLSEIPIIKYASKSLIKFLIECNITVDTDLLKGRDLYDDIIQYKKITS
ncbi:ankyrin repeat domain-containing protein [Citrobacter portucalensis]|uniref:ankyrin repeat domain-containing protein n=1 Tax=Citrobacter portucalensis TaxID=1639133 RepID=UPI003CF8B3D6